MGSTLQGGRTQDWFHRLSAEDKSEYVEKYPGTKFHKTHRVSVTPNPYTGIGMDKTAPSRETVAINSFSRNTVMNTLNIVDYRMKSPTLAKVIISFTGAIDADFIKEEIGRKMGHLATVVKSSFKQISPGTAVGFIRANSEVRVLDGEESKLTAKYRVMSSNILMDKSDQSLWDLKSGASGKYLTCRGQEDLSELVEAGMQRRSDAARLSQITIARAAPSEMVAFVDDQGDVDHGFAIATSDDKVKVVSFNRRVPLTVDYDSVVSIYPVTVPGNLSREVNASLTADQKKQSKDYYTRLYSYSPEYLAMVIKQIDEGTVA